jgi:hypothetical protein
LKFKTVLSTYAKAGGKSPVLLLHSQERGQQLVEELGRAAQLKKANGVPANVIPLALWHTASVGADLWLSAIAFGASQVCVAVTSEEAPQYIDSLKAQMEVAQAILNGLGYTGVHFQLLRADSPQELDLGLQALAQTRQQSPAQRPGSPSPRKSAARWNWLSTIWWNTPRRAPKPSTCPRHRRSARSRSIKKRARCA